ncbi:glycosyltransferase family 4 protein [Methanothermobacter sp. K4]|uniref:glycosyltransferase family 4 protein n=1 Tax=Methanothermobacter sp. K4 TaxID=2913262 RepID=UPI001EDC0CB3|nr:glycosyltransferase family 4 protein [Methanothermobacter sp. K4]MCG2829235.1 glycosyltransferase family 4 protein [Methanothermobacter sp. K4]
MKILSVIIGAPDKDSSLWFRIKKQAELLFSLGHEVELCFYSRQKLTFEPSFKYSVIRVSPLSVHLKHFLKISKEKYDLVFCNLAPTAFICSLSKIKGIPILLDNHGDLISEMDLLKPGLLRSIYYRIISSLSFSVSDVIICVSHLMIKDLMQRGIPRRKLHYVTNATDLNLFKPLDNQEIKNMKMNLGIVDKLTFGYIGADDRWQGIDNLIKTTKFLNDNNVFFLYVGFPKNKRRYHNALFLPKVEFNKVKYYYGACDVLVLPRPSHKSAEVAAPTKFAEYVAMGKPILTTDVGDAAEFVRKYKCGIVVEDNQPENLLRGINEFKSLSKDDLMKMGNNSRKMAEKEFSLKKMREDLEKVLNSFNNLNE